MMRSLMFALALSFLPALAAAGQPVAMDKATQESMTPEQVLERLLEGNARFVAAQAAGVDHIAQVRATATGQYPVAAVLGCIDSRVPIELVLDQGIGDIFGARIAGNFVNEDLLGSLEFATQLAGSKVVMVMGHTSCGAVKGACDGAELGNLTQMLDKIEPAVNAVQGVDGPRNSKNAAFVQAVAEKNVEMAVADLIERSPVMAGLVDQDKLLIVGAMYDVATGQVTLLPQGS